MKIKDYKNRIAELEAELEANKNMELYIGCPFCQNHWKQRLGEYKK